MVDVVLKFIILQAILYCFTPFSSYSQAGDQHDRSLSIMFYNVQNFYDTVNDSTVLDEFTPDDIYNWSTKRFISKRQAIADAILNADSVRPLVLVGLCEVENRGVLQQLIDSTALKDHRYQILHHDSPDKRGIDVALLYTDDFTLTDSAFLSMGCENANSREILYAKGVVYSIDTLHVFVCHFPSKRDGALKTAPLRLSAAFELRGAIDSILHLDPYANIVAMGDFNDTYNSQTFTQGLKLSKDTLVNIHNDLCNLSLTQAKAGYGTVKFAKRWQMVDLFLVSRPMLSKTSPLHCSYDDFEIVKLPFLLEYVESHNSYRPKPTYRWINYIGGYSDHLPVLLKLHYQ